MADEDDKTRHDDEGQADASPSHTGNRADGAAEHAENEQAVQTAEAKFGIRDAGSRPTQGLSQSPGLREIANSQVPRADYNHVHGPQQAPADPIAAGLDVAHHPLTRAENRAVTLTGEDGSGPHLLPVDSDNSHRTVPASPDAQPAIGEVPEVRKAD